MIWEKAAKRAKGMLTDGIVFHLTLNMMGTVPVRFVQRGEERFE